MARRKVKVGDGAGAGDGGDGAGEQSAEDKAGGDGGLFDGARPSCTTADMAPCLNDFQFLVAGHDNPHAAKGPISHRWPLQF